MHVDERTTYQLSVANALKPHAPLNLAVNEICIGSMLHRRRQLRPPGHFPGTIGEMPEASRVQWYVNDDDACINQCISIQPHIAVPKPRKMPDRTVICSSQTLFPAPTACGFRSAVPPSLANLRSPPVNVPTTRVNPPE